MDKSSNNLESTNDPTTRKQDQKSESVIVKESHDTHQSPSPEKEGTSTNVVSDQKLDAQNDNPGSESESHQEENALAIMPKEDSTSASEDHDNYIVAIRPEKGLDKLPLRRNTDNVAHTVSPDPGITFSKLPEKPTGDGYNWRKYGQKLVKGNTFVRSYYKCTSANCPARKQVERSHDGHITEINYLWKHEHPKPPHTLVKGSAFVIPVQSRAPDDPSFTTSEDHSSVHPATSHDPEASETATHKVVPPSENSIGVAVSHSNEMKHDINNDTSSDSKRQKRETSNINEGISTKTNCEPRLVVQTTSAVDIVNDGYRWRKYGQKLVKGNPNPRSYYRCSSAGCPAKKHVERASHDEKVVITTYEGRHDHDMPAGGRTVTQNMSGTASGTTTVDNNDGRESSNGMEVVVHVNAT